MSVQARRLTPNYGRITTLIVVGTLLATQLYIWLITLAMIVSSHYSSTAAKVVGRNAPKVLATLFLLSYSKLINTLIAALSFTLLQYPNKQQAVWMYDGNVQYLTGKLIPLFLAAVFILILFFIPYTNSKRIIQKL